MRDIALTAFIFGLLPFVLWRPHWGVLMWTWIGLMNPHRLTWNFAYSFQFASVVGAITLLAVLISREPKRLPLQLPVIVLVLFIGWMTLSTIFSLYPDQAWKTWDKVMKIQLFILVTLIVMQQRSRIEALVWVSTLSLAFYGIKGGLYTVAGGGVGMVLGPPGGFIAGNTEISLALIMTIPMMRWLQLRYRQRWLRWGLGAAIGLTVVAVLGSYSRGALLAIAGMAVFLWLKSRHKLWTAVALLALVPFALSLMPAEWYGRMGTIQTYEEDNSAMGRINAWHFAYNLARSRPLTGGGFETFQRDAFPTWAPEPDQFHDAHSIWFEVLGEQGFVGLGLYLALAFFTWRTGSYIIRVCRGRKELQWAADLAAMVQVSLVGFWVGGSFLGLAYWDYPYVLMCLLVLTKVVVKRDTQAHAAASERLEAPVDGIGTPREVRPTTAPG